MSAMATAGNLLDEIGTLADIKLELQAAMRMRPALAADILNLEPGVILTGVPEMGDRIEIHVNKILLAEAKVIAVGDRMAVRIIEFAGEV